MRKSLILGAGHDGYAADHVGPDRRRSLIVRRAGL